MKKKFFKHSLLVILVIIIGVICLAAYFKAKQLQPDPNFTEFTAYQDHADYIDAIKQDASIPTDILNELLKRAENDPSIHYGLFVYHLQVTSKYTVRPYFFVQYEQDEENQKITKIEYGNINRQDVNKNKQFIGKMFYNIESLNKIAWQLEGKFMNGNTTSESRKYWDTGGVTVEYSANEESTYYHYLNTEGYISFQDLSKK
ncbi:hypothetical protein [Beduini massiliensis]|uniref:hypothetical protein n=1 Tax=Beduini massiliensis TaxID=1585974 RepID=UPI00059AB407|nr:hypothetical protein [Beduini massiliensis]